MTEPCPSKKKTVFIRRQAREMARNVLECCLEERQASCLKITINNAYDRASRYTGLSKRTLAFIHKEAKEGVLRNPSKKGNKCNRKNLLNIDDYDRSLIHHLIEDFYLTKQIVPTCPKLLAAIREEIEFPFATTSLRKLLKQMGYKWLKCHNKRHILVENPTVVFARAKYLREIRQYRQDGRNIIFLDETLIDENLTFNKQYWRNEVMDLALTDTNQKGLIIVHAGSRHGFLNNAKLVFEGHMSEENFGRWVTNFLIPNLPPESVVVLDNKSFHSVQENKVPSKASTKKIMFEWLTRNSVEASPNMRRDELFHLAELHKPPEKTFTIDQLIRSHGHDVLRLPQFMCDLNLMELVWQKIKNILKQQKIKKEDPLDFAVDTMSDENLKALTELAISQITDADWRNFDDKVRLVEDTYWEKDEIMEDAIDRLVTEVSDDEDSDTGSAMSGLIILDESDEE